MTDLALVTPTAPAPAPRVQFNRVGRDWCLVSDVPLVPGSVVAVTLKDGRVKQVRVASAVFAYTCASPERG